MRIVLLVAPIAETVIVVRDAHRSAGSQVGASATVFTAGDLERRQTPLLADLLRRHARRDDDPQRRARRRHLAVRARRREQLQQGAARRHAAERAGRHVRLHQPHHREPRAGRGGPRRAVGAVRIGRDGRASIQLFTTRRRRRTPPAGLAQIDGGTYGTLHATRQRGRRAPARFDYCVGAARVQRPTTRAEQRVRQHDAVSANGGVALAGRRRCGSSAAPSSSTSARPARRRSAGRISTRSSSGTTASAA